MSVLNQIGDEQKECPLCLEPFEVDDLTFFPCTCLYQICRFCWHRLRTDGNGLCPACRKAYPENPADFTPLSQEQILALKAKKRHQDQQKKQKTIENRKHLANVRVVQKNLVFVVGLPMRLADAEVLKKHEYFGKFGKILKVVINQSTSYAGPQGPSASAYVTYSHNNDALRAIQSVNNISIEGRQIKTSLGTTKYCSHFMKNLPCPKPDCMYLHELADAEASFTKEQMQQGKHQEYEKKLHDTLIQSTSAATKTDRTGITGTTNSASQSKEAWPSLMAGTSQSTAKEKKCIKEAGKTDKSCSKADKQLMTTHATHTTHSKQMSPKSADIKDHYNKTTHKKQPSTSKQKSEPIINTGIPASSTWGGRKTPIYSTKTSNCSESDSASGESSPEPSEKSSEHKSTNVFIKLNGERVLNNRGNQSNIDPIALAEHTAQMSRLSILDDSSFFSVETFRKYFPAESKTTYTSSVESHSVSPDSLDRSPYLETTIDGDHILNNDLNRNLSKNNSNDNSGELYRHGSQQHMCRLSDFIPLESPENWEATYGYMNGKHGDFDDSSNSHEHSSNASPPEAPLMSNGYNSHMSSDLENGDFKNDSSFSDAEEHRLLDSDPIHEHFTNSMSKFMCDYYKNNTKCGAQDSLGRPVDMSTSFNSCNNGYVSDMELSSGMVNKNNVLHSSNYPNEYCNGISHTSPRNGIPVSNDIMTNRAGYAKNNYVQEIEMLHQLNMQERAPRQIPSQVTHEMHQHVPQQTVQGPQQTHMMNSMFSNNHRLKSVDDDLGFDPFHETQKALAELMENELIIQQQNSRVNDTTYDGMSQRTRLPPPGFNHMNAFGIGVPRAQASKLLPHMTGHENHSQGSNAWPSPPPAFPMPQSQFQQQMPQGIAYQQQGMPIPHQPHQVSPKGFTSMCSDWTTMDPAIMITSRNFGHAPHFIHENKQDDRREIFMGHAHQHNQKTMFCTPPPQQVQQSLGNLHSQNNIHQIPQPLFNPMFNPSQPPPNTSQSQGPTPSQQQQQQQQHIVVLPSQNHMSMLKFSGLGNMSMPPPTPINQQPSWSKSEPSFYSNGFSSNLENSFSVPPGFRDTSTRVQKSSNKAECIEIK